MSNPTLLDGSDGPRISSLYTMLKGHLTEVLLILDSLDSGSLGKLKDENEYKAFV